MCTRSEHSAVKRRGRREATSECGIKNVVVAGGVVGRAKRKKLHSDWVLVSVRAQEEDLIDVTVFIKSIGKISLRSLEESLGRKMNVWVKQVTEAEERNLHKRTQANGPSHLWGRIIPEQDCLPGTISVKKVGIFWHLSGAIQAEDTGETVNNWVRAMVEMCVYLATHLPKAGMYELHGGSCGPLLRAGQVVRAEVGFQIVPAGKNRYMLRMDLKSVAIINDKIVVTMAFAGVTAVSTQAKQTISLSSAGPSGLVVASKPRIKRTNRKPKNLNKESQDVEATMIELPFQSE
ncbi:hypothetical protein PENSPDRAFT_671973 [Peniophora sp. CONT]|nr:hypothetical protein PENSPDRAFT_671973 [Peniophora sp. CONT]